MFIFPIVYEDEIFKFITEKEVPGIDIVRYMCSNYGRIYDRKNNRYTAICFDKGGYLHVSIHTLNGFKSILLHRIVAMLFVEGDTTLTVNHKNGCKTDVSYTNLEWITQRDNLIHAVETGLNYRGEDKPNAKLTNEQVHKICNLLECGTNYDIIVQQIPEISNIPNIKKMIADIKRGKTFKFISRNYNISEYIRRNRLLTDEQVHIVCKIFETQPKTPYKDILNILNIVVSNNQEFERYRHMLQSIKFRDAYTDISKNYNW